MTANPTLFDATPSALGYLYQCRYALLLLLRKGRNNLGIAVYIERFDDISFDQNGTPLERIQTKHHVGTTGNLTNASPDLWKTLRIWSEDLSSGRLRTSESFLTIVTTATASSGHAPSLLRFEGRNEAKALQILEHTANTSTNNDNRLAYQAFLKLSQQQKQELLGIIYILDDAPNIVDVQPLIRDELARVTYQSQLDSLVQGLEGWWFQKVISHLAGTGQEPIRSDDIEIKIDDLREKFRRDNLPVDYCFIDPPDPPDPEKDQRDFVHQLRLIKVFPITISNAICDHYKSFQQRSYWVREHLLLVDDLKTYDDSLVNEWQRRMASEQEDLAVDPQEEDLIKAGRRLYRWSQDQDIRIRPECSHPVITRGSYQLLADRRHVGWHPRYAELMTLWTEAKP